MARRPAVEHGPDMDVSDEAFPSSHGPMPRDPWNAADMDDHGGRSGRGGPQRWRGSGGRWWIWVGRAVLWALILVILVNGIRAPFERFTESDSPASATPSAGEKDRFPVSAASAYALQFGNVYFNYDQKTAADREKALRSFIPEETDTQFGWNRVGNLQMQSVQVAAVEARDSNNAVVTLLARSQDKWFQLAVPVYAKGTALLISGRPALLPPPTRANLPQLGERDRDSGLEGELGTALGGFFTAYARSDQAALTRFSDQASITGLGNTVTFARLNEVVAPRGGPDQRTVTARVTWQIPPPDGRGTTGELEQTYELTVVKKDGKWYVRDIRGATRPTG